MLYEIILLILLLIIIKSFVIIKEYERGVKFTLGKFSGLMNPGLRIVLPFIQTFQKVDIRIKAVDVPNQECITKDNITVGINAVIYYKIIDAKKAIIDVEDYYYATSQIAQTTMRNIVGEVELDELLQQREKISSEIKKIVDEATDPWGIAVQSVELKDITIPENLKRVIGRQAEAEREKRAVIIKSEGEVTAAKNISKAAKMLSENNGALHLRTLQTLNDISSDQSNTIIFTLPLEILEAFKSMKKK